MEEHIGRFLSGIEVVHHENDIRSDNLIDNLLLFPDQSTHLRYHHIRDRTPLYNPETVETVRRLAADPTVTVKNSGLARCTIWRICKKYGIQWVSPQVRNLDPALVSKVLQEHTRQEACRILDVNLQTLWNRFPELMRKTATRKLLKWGA
jgi:DNA invertase Pin-like site-specific DNA recombinase